MFYNSTKNKRGVAILIKNSIQYEILEQKNSDCENILLLKVKIKNSEIILICIYGPNGSDMEFFNTINEYLLGCNNVPVLMGGDWNCTGSCDIGAENIDCLNMARPPNITNSRRLSVIREDFDLSDPYRYLYPDAAEFTYIPRAAGKKNRSRLDFFLVSDSLLDNINECKISDYLQNKLFDHKAVTLYLNKKSEPDTGTSNRPTISNKELNDELLPFLVKTSVSETYLIHVQADIIHGIRRENLLHTCGTIRNLIRECGPPFEHRLGENITEEKIASRARKIVRAEFLTSTLNLHHFETLNLTVDPDIFMETLLNNVKNDVISHQSFVRKVKKEKIKGLIKSIGVLKNNLTENEEEIFAKEKELNLLIDCELRTELERFRHFDILHTEKMAPRFLSLTKNNKQTASLDKIKKADGSDFADPLQRQEYIRDFYRDIYTPVTGNNVLGPNCINDFLGPEIYNNPIVLNAKLSGDESLLYDRPLSIQELDNAVNKSNPNSAGGLDGIGGKFIKQFWAYLRSPLHRYANYCIDKGTLTQSFDSAGIRLIPKKGDVTQIKNWRPISLLNCIYKIIAKALDNRLKKVNEIILSRAQKGFTSNRQIQECVINIIENISYCQGTRTPGFILALDMAKAFDTVRHDFMNHVCI
jgi:exonuclease III